MYNTKGELLCRSIVPFSVFHFPFSDFFVAYQNLEPISKQLTIVIGLTVVGFMAFGLALSFYRNLLFEQTLENMREQNEALQNHIEHGYRTLEYYKSTQYKDKYAKENLGLISPEESALIITDATNTDPILIEKTESSNQQKEAAYFGLLRQMPVLEHWMLYLFHRDKIDEIRMGI